MRTVLYSAIFGGYDKVPPLPETPGIDRVMFTDDPDLEAEGWEIEIRAPHPDVHPRMAAKQFKLLPHWCLPDYDRRVWMDGSHRLITADAVPGALAAVGVAGVAMHRHPGRDCVYDEARASITMEKYQGQPIVEQADAYAEEGHPAHWGLWACGTIASHHSADELFEAWWKEVNAWSYQDQISWPVVCRRAGVRPGEFAHPQVPSPWFQVGGHVRND